MTSPWELLTLSNFSPQQWRETSYLYRLVGFGRSWRNGSYLMEWNELIGAILLSIIIILSPFVSTALIGVLLLAVGLYWLLLTLSDRGKPTVTPIHTLALLYWGIMTVATAFSPVRVAALEGWRNTTLFLLLFALASQIFRNRRLSNFLWIVFLLVALVVSSYGVYQSIHGAPPLATWSDPTSPSANNIRVYSYLNNPNLLAGYTLPALAMSMAACFAWQRPLPKLLAILMTIIHSICLYFTDSRGGWIGFVVLFSVFVVLLYSGYNSRLPSFWRIWLIPIIFGVLASILVLGLLLIEPLRLRVLSIFVGRGDSSNNFRINVWLSAIQMIKDRPILGIGPGHGTFNKIYPLYMQPRFSALGAYSIYLENAVELGIFGLISFLWLVLVTFWTGFRGIVSTGNFWLIGALAGLASILAQGFVDTVWYRPEIHTIWWLLVALVASKYSALNASSPVPYPVDHPDV
jgi:putative inorganic carbon (hco3(-)) transporter